MATSGSIDYTVTAIKVIEEAFSYAGVKEDEEPLTAAMRVNGFTTLNLMIKAWQSQRLHLWAKQEAVIFLDVNKSEYKLGVSGDEACNLDDFVSTSTTSEEALSSTVIEVTSTSGMLALDNVGIKLDDNTRHWTTIVSVDSSTQITIAIGLPSVSSAASSVFTFTNFIERPLRILGVRNAKYGSDNEFEIRQFSRQEYFNQPNKLSNGSVVNYYYSPQLDQGGFYVWPTTSSVDDYVRITFERNLEDVDANSDNLDFPIEWAETVIFNLAARLSVKYDAPVSKQEKLSVLANSTLEALLGYDEEPSSLNIRPRFN